MEFRQKTSESLILTKFLTLNLKANTVLNINYLPSNYSFLNKNVNYNFFKKNFTKFFFFFFFFYFYFFKKHQLLSYFFYDLKLTCYFLKKKENVLNFLKSPNRFKMARNQLSFYKNSVKLRFDFFFLNTSDIITSNHNHNYYCFFLSFKSLPFSEIFESNFFFLKNIKLTYYNHKQLLPF